MEGHELDRLDAQRYRWLMSQIASRNLVVTRVNGNNQVPWASPEDVEQKIDDSLRVANSVASLGNANVTNMGFSNAETMEF